MQKHTVVMLSLLVGLYAAQAFAADVAPAAAKPVAKHKVHKHPCVEQEGKPCHLKNHAGEAASKEVKPAEQAPLERIKSAVPAVVVPVAALPAVYSEAASAVPSVPAAETVALARSSGCLACHSIEGVPGGGAFGPKWHDVAKRYRGDANAEAFLVNKIARGGSGVWGRNAMPANSPRVNDANIRILARFVLNLQ